MVCAMTIILFKVDMLAWNPRERLLKLPLRLMPIPSSPRPPSIVEVMLGMLLMLVNVQRLGGVRAYSI